MRWGKIHTCFHLVWLAISFAPPKSCHSNAPADDSTEVGSNSWLVSIMHCTCTSHPTDVCGSSNMSVYVFSSQVVSPVWVLSIKMGCRADGPGGKPSCWYCQLNLQVGNTLVIILVIEPHTGSLLCIDPYWLYTGLFDDYSNNYYILLWLVLFATYLQDVCTALVGCHSVVVRIPPMTTNARTCRKAWTQFLMALLHHFPLFNMLS